MIRDDLTTLITQAASRAQDEGALPASAGLLDPAIEHPQNPDHGDYATSLPLKLARAARMNPLQIARVIAERIPENAAIASVDVAPPGFINLRLRDEWLAGQVEAIRQAGEGYGSSAKGAGKTVQIEFVSANPTGPVHVGNGRGAVLGTTLANLFAAAGYGVTKEYYVNDAGLQVEVFSRSLHARYLQALGQQVPFPEEGYQGHYMVELGKQFAEQYGDRFAGEPLEGKAHELGRIGLAQMLDNIRADLALLGVEYDVWFNESSLYTQGQYEKAMTLLRERGFVVERDGALWFASTSLGEDKDNVLVRSNGIPTYFAADAAYHANKFIERKFDRVIDIWGADHQGHVARVKAVVGALGADPDNLTVILYQLVTLKRGGEVVRLSKRTGDIITMREVVEEVGADACRFVFLSRSADSQMDFDLELAKKQSNENPVYYVQYAHARVAGILRQARERGLTWADGDVRLLTTEPELALIRKMLLLPEHIESALFTLEPHILPHYAQELATVFHKFYDTTQVMSNDRTPVDPALTAARLKLVEATQIVLARTLRLMGMAAPERM